MKNGREREGGIKGGIGGRGEEGGRGRSGRENMVIVC